MTACPTNAPIPEAPRGLMARGRRVTAPFRRPGLSLPMPVTAAESHRVFAPGRHVTRPPRRPRIRAHSRASLARSASRLARDMATRAALAARPRCARDVGASLAGARVRRHRSPALVARADGAQLGIVGADDNLGHRGSHAHRAPARSAGARPGRACDHGRARSWRQGKLFISSTLAGELIGLHTLDSRYVQVVFANLLLGLIDTHQPQYGLVRPKPDLRRERSTRVSAMSPV